MQPNPQTYPLPLTEKNPDAEAHHIILSVCTTFEHVGPARGAELLLFNRNYRRLTEHGVDHWARLMTAGQWKVSGETIKFVITGWMIDGQHRLKAIVKTGLTLPFEIRWGLDPDVSEILDTGQKRRAATYFAALGEPHADTLASACRLLWDMFQRTLLRRAEMPSIEDLKHVLKETPTFARAAPWARRCAG